MNRKAHVDRRKHERYRAEFGSLVMLKPNTCGVGQIIEISVGGLTFDYLTGKSPSMEATELRILVPRTSFRLDRIPCQGIWDLGLYEIPRTSLLKRRCRVKFGELTTQQASQIDYFIENHTAGPNTSYVTEPMSHRHGPDIKPRSMQMKPMYKEELNDERKKKILIADDDSSIHDLLTEALRTEKYDIIHAYNGKETLQHAEEELPDLVILDIMMPFSDGRDICKQLKSSPETSHMKILVLSGKGEQHDRILGLELGADDYIPKPASIHYITRKIASLLEK